MKMKEILWVGLLAAAMVLGSGCGQGDRGPPDGGKGLSAKEKRARIEALKQELARLKVEIEGLQRDLKATESELTKAHAEEGE